MKKFVLPKDPSSTQKNIRFPDYLLEEVEGVIRGTNITFSAFVVEAVKVALENLREDAEERAP